jgi:hypothetical protein
VSSPTQAKPGRVAAQVKPNSALTRRVNGKADSTFAGVEVIQRPAPIGEEAFIGITGRFVRAVGPHTEADPSFVSLSFLAYAGNLFGREAHVLVCGDRHFPNLFICGVGSTSTGRKGSAKAPVDTFFRTIEPDWLSNATSGLSSGEGVINAVRDPVFKKVTGKKGESEPTIEDEGVADKRLVIRQSEFAAALSVMRRDGNTLSPTLRDAWDGLPLNTMVKNSPTKATDAHITLIGNITAEELLRLLENEVDNGLSNRFLWCCSCRSKFLPEGGEDFLHGRGSLRSLGAQSYARPRHVLGAFPREIRHVGEDYQPRARTGFAPGSHLRSVGRGAGDPPAASRCSIRGLALLRRIRAVHFRRSAGQPDRRYNPRCAQANTGRPHSARNLGRTRA